MTNTVVFTFKLNRGAEKRRQEAIILWRGRERVRNERRHRERERDTHTHTHKERNRKCHLFPFSYIHATPSFDVYEFYLAELLMYIVMKRVQLW